MSSAGKSRYSCLLRLLNFCPYATLLSQAYQMTPAGISQLIRCKQCANLHAIPIRESFRSLKISTSKVLRWIHVPKSGILAISPGMFGAKVFVDWDTPQGGRGTVGGTD